MLVAKMPALSGASTRFRRSILAKRLATSLQSGRWLALLLLLGLMPRAGYCESSLSQSPQKTAVNAVASTSILIDTTHRTLTLMRNDEAILFFKNISIGRGGSSNLHMQGDNTTPKGSYRIISKKTRSQYTLFLELDYPTVDHAELALAENKITLDDYAAIVRANKLGLAPPDTTPLGGAIGIHGIGNGDLDTHRDFNWTHGCVALENDQIIELARWVEAGVRVHIQ